MSDELKAGVEYNARLIQIVRNKVHFYPADGGEAITFRLQHDAFLMNPATEYHADGVEITIVAPNSNWVKLMVESWIKPGTLADRIVIK